MPTLCWLELALVPLVHSAMSKCLFCGVCELSMSLGILSADGWGCVPVFLVTWPEISCTGAWVEPGLDSEMEISG